MFYFLIKCIGNVLGKDEISRAKKDNRMLIRALSILFGWSQSSLFSSLIDFLLMMALHGLNEKKELINLVGKARVEPVVYLRLLDFRHPLSM